MSTALERSGRLGGPERSERRERLERLDQRTTSYRFDLEADVPWARLAEPGVFFPPTFLRRLGVHPRAVARTPGARRSLDVLLALATARLFGHLEEDVIRFVEGEGRRRPSRSAALLTEEEHKHVALFRRLHDELARAHPREAEALARCSGPPPSFEHLRARAGDYASADELAYTFWLNTLFFEEYTVYFQYALEERQARDREDDDDHDDDHEPGPTGPRGPAQQGPQGEAEQPVQPTWLAAHRCHRQEELQHVLTDAAYLHELAVDAAARRRLSKSFLLFLDESFGAFFGVAAASRALASMYPGVDGLPADDARLTKLPLFDDVQTHRAFRLTRRAAPWLDELAGTDARASARAILDGGAPAIHPAPTDTLARRLEEVAAAGRGGLVFVELDGREQTLSMEELLAAAEARLAVLNEEGARPGDAVILLTAMPSATVPWFHACVLGGLVVAPVALPTTAEDTAELERLLRVHRQLGAPWLVADDAVAPLLADSLQQAGVARPRVIAASRVGPATRAVRHAGQVDDVAFIQFSSGSMGDPRGVLLSHGNLLADIQGMVRVRGAGDRETFVSWMPLCHDMGLIGYHLTPLVSGALQVLSSPLAFMRDPLSWPRALSHHRATVTGAPNFALARLLPRLSPEVTAGLELSALHTFLVGAEPISRRVLDAFLAALAPAGLRAEALCPAYGLAEATLAVTMSLPGERPRSVRVLRESLAPHSEVLRLDAGDAGDEDDQQDEQEDEAPRARAHEATVDLVDLGPPLPGVRLRIVDEQGAVVPPGVVGHIELLGPTVTRGYHGEPAPVAGAPPRWLATGDLGFVDEGRLFVTGRHKDVFFLGGRNHYAHDVEAVAREVPAVHPGAVGLAIDWNERWGVDELVLFVGLQDGVTEPRAALQAVHAHVRRRMGISLDRLVAIDKRAVPRTTSGKLKRRALLARLRAREGDAVSYVPPAAPSSSSSSSSLLSSSSSTSASPPAALAPEPRGAASASADASMADEDVAAVRGAWADVLGLPLAAVGADDDFRGLGGDSLKATRIHDRVEQLFGGVFSPDLLVVGTTPRRMAAFVREARGGRSGGHKPGPPPVAPPGAPPAGTRVAVDAGAMARARGTRPPRAGSVAVAVVALAVRAPGVATPAAFWQLLVEGRTTIGRTPPSRRADARVFDEDALTHGAWLDAVDRFDPGPFSLSDDEARAMGPAQRLFLEVAFEALAGSALSSRRVGVFVGAGGDGYGQRYVDDPHLVGGHSLLGALPNMVAARVSRAFGLSGPALAIDTACSSSLAAVHLACQSLRAGECEAAVAGGVQVGLAGELLRSFQQAGLLSSSGACRPFDEDAAGLVPGEAAGAVVLKLLERAREDGDTVLAVVRGSAMNNDGGALSGTAPSPRGQAEVVARAWQQAALDPACAAFVEAHAAGTAIGDAVEARALAPLLTARREPCLLGSVKGNVGHTLAAAGIMSFLKAVLALHHRQLPPTPGLVRPSPRIDFASTKLSVVTRGTALRAPRIDVGDGGDGGDRGDDAPLRGGVSSFGLGGTNVHLVVEDAAAEEPEAAAGDSRELGESGQSGEPRPLVFCIGAPPGGLAGAIAAARDLVSAPASSLSSLSELAAAANGFAALLPERRAVVVRTRAELAAALDALAREAAEAPEVWPGSKRRGKVAFVLPGPGSQVPGMGRALFQAEPVFRAALERCAAIAGRHDVDLLALLLAAAPAGHGGAAPIHRLEHAQPAVFSFGYALACWLGSLGIEPEVLVGHSAGEYVAAHLAGMLDLDDALGLVIERGRAMARAAPGRMAAVLGARALVEEILRGLPPGPAAGVGIAAVNAPEQVVISGAQADVEEAARRLEAQGLSVRMLDVDCAAHSSSLLAAAAAFEAALARVSFAPGRVPVVSTTTADLLPAADSAHFLRHLTSPVDFAAAVRRARSLGADVFVELGATAGLSTCVRQTLAAEGDDALVVACGARDRLDLSAPAEAVATLVDAGLPVRTGRLHPRRARDAALRALSVWPWPWRRRRLWIDAPAGRAMPSSASGSASASAPAPSPPPAVELTLESHVAVRDHRTAGVSSAPASLLVDVLVDVLGRSRGPVELGDTVVLRPLVVARGETRAVHVVADPAGVGGDAFLVRTSSPASAGAGEPVVHLSTRALPARGRVASRLDLDDIRARLPREVPGARIYARLDRTGFVMGPAMRAVESVWRGDGELLARLVSPPGTTRGRRVDPALLDGASHAVAAFFVDDVSAAAVPAMFLGFSLERVRLHRPVHDRCLAWVRLRAPLTAESTTLRYDIVLAADDGEILAEVDDFAARRVAPTGGALPADPASPRVSTNAARAPVSMERAAPATRSTVKAVGDRAALVDLVRDLVAVRLARAPEQIGEHAPLVRLGVDSLMAVELVRRLEERLGIKLYATLLFDAHTVGEVADRLAGLLRDAGRSVDGGER